jgi:hypothetical protein
LTQRLFLSELSSIRRMFWADGCRTWLPPSFLLWRGCTCPPHSHVAGQFHKFLSISWHSQNRGQFHLYSKTSLLYRVFLPSLSHNSVGDHKYLGSFRCKWSLLYKKNGFHFTLVKRPVRSVHSAYKNWLVMETKAIRSMQLVCTQAGNKERFFCHRRACNRHTICQYIGLPRTWHEPWWCSVISTWVFELLLNYMNRMM